MQAEYAIEFDRIKEIWAEYALTDWAKEQIRDIRPYLSEVELRTRLRETGEAKTLIEKAGAPPLVSLSGIREMLLTAGIGEALSAAQLEEIEKALTAVKRLKSYLEKSKGYGLSMPYYEENLDALENLREMICRQIRNGRVDDYASKQLKSIRSDIERAEEKMRDAAENVMKGHRDCMADSFSTYRGGHLCVPVKKECKHKISGSVLDKSRSGGTLFIEPDSVAKYYGQIQLLRLDEENEVRRILFELTAMVADNAEIIEQNNRTIEKLDFVFSRGKLSLKLNASEPAINTQRIIEIKDGRHPLMDEKLCVPLQFEIGKDVQGIVITGPNTGGKTVAIKTVALNCMMAQCGLHVTCGKADICMNSNYLCDIGDGQNLSENLSTFSAHITNVMDILKNVNGESLVIMDELGSGTDPTEGMGIAIAILEELRKSGALFLVTTHYPEVKQYAESRKGIINARMTFDRESLKPLYQLVIGEAGESCAFYIAGRLGMPEEMLRIARQAAYSGNFKGCLTSDDSGENCLPGFTGSNQPETVENLKDKTCKTPVGIPKIQKKKDSAKNAKLADKFRRGDSVIVYPDKKTGIVCRPVNEKGVLQVQLPDRKIWINHKRVKLHVAAEELYPEDYDFSIIFDTVENRKLKHQMERKYVEGKEIRWEE